MILMLHCVVAGSEHEATNGNDKSDIRHHTVIYSK